MNRDSFVQRFLFTILSHSFTNITSLFYKHRLSPPFFANNHLKINYTTNNSNEPFALWHRSQCNALHRHPITWHTWNYNLVYSLLRDYQGPQIFRRLGEGQRSRSMIFSIVHLFTISCGRRIASPPPRELLRGCTQRSPFARVDYDAKRTSATGATISMQMSRRATNTKPREGRRATREDGAANKGNERGWKREGEKSSNNVLLLSVANSEKSVRGNMQQRGYLKKIYTFSYFDTHRRACFQKKYFLLWIIFCKNRNTSGYLVMCQIKILAISINRKFWRYLIDSLVINHQ